MIRFYASLVPVGPQNGNKQNVTATATAIPKTTPITAPTALTAPAHFEESAAYSLSPWGNLQGTSDHRRLLESAVTSSASTPFSLA